MTKTAKSPKRRDITDRHKYSFNTHLTYTYSISYDIIIKTQKIAQILYGGILWLTIKKKQLL